MGQEHTAQRRECDLQVSESDTVWLEVAAQLHLRTCGSIARELARADRQLHQCRALPGPGRCSVSSLREGERCVSVPLLQERDSQKVAEQVKGEVETRTHTPLCKH